MTREPARRPFQLGDATILIAGAAAVLALLRRSWDLYFPESFFKPPPLGWSPGVIVHRALSAVGYLVAQVAAVAAVALLAIRLRGPRPSMTRLARQPGLVACATVTLVGALSMAEYLAQILMIGVQNPFAQGFSYETLNVLMDGLWYSFTRNGYAVAATWMTLAMGGRWRPEPGWIDRSGRAVGIFWIATIPLYTWLLATSRQ